MTAVADHLCSCSVRYVGADQEEMVQLPELDNNGVAQHPEQVVVAGGRNGAWTDGQGGSCATGAAPGV